MATTTNRLQALDVMRGLAIAAMIVFNNSGHHFAPLCHAEWNGLTPTDLAYPFFMFIMGVSVCFSMRKAAERGKGRALLRILRRAASIFILGLFLSNFSKMVNGTFCWEGMRIMGVLQRLALVYLTGALIYLYVPRKWHLPIALTLLAAYIAILKCLNGYVHGEENVIARIDAAILGKSHMYHETVDGVKIAFEPESILGTISGTAHVLLGSFAGGLVLDNPDNADRVRKIAVFGAILLFAGFLLQYLDPVNKKIWTSSYTLVTCGSASLLLALLIDIIDIHGHRKWSGFFNLLGTNAVLAYTLASLLASTFSATGFKKWLMATVLSPLGPAWGCLVYALLLIGIIALLIFPLYRHKIYIRL